MMGSCPSIDLTMHVHGRHPGGVLPKEFGKVETAVDGCNSWVLRGDSILEDKNGVCIFIITPGQMSLRVRSLGQSEFKSIVPGGGKPTPTWRLLSRSLLTPRSTLEFSKLSFRHALRRM